MTYLSILEAHGYRFDVASDHSATGCYWCRQAKETAVQHMRDATLKTTKSTKWELHSDIPHVVQLTRAGRITASASAMPTVPAASIYMSDRGLNRYANGATPNEAKLITEVVNLRIKLSRRRPVVLDLTETEAATVLDLLAHEEEILTSAADAAYQDGTGFESECALARNAAADVEKLEDRLRKALAAHLDKAYAGELEA